MRSDTGCPMAVVQAFCAAWSGADVDHIVGFLADDVIWENVPIGVVRGRAAAAARIAAAFAGASRIDWQVRAIALADDGQVLTEREDILVLPGGEVRLPIMGIFRTGPDGIVLWRDYFDLGDYDRQRARCRGTGEDRQ